MSDSSATTIRLVLLVLVTLLFAAAWRMDRPREEPAVDMETAEEWPLKTSNRWNRHRTTESPHDSAATDRSMETGESLTSRSTPIAPIEMVALVPTQDAGELRGLSLPPDLAPGEYRVVNDAGLTAELVVEVEDLGEHAAWSIRDLYHVRKRGTNWYFIRVRHQLAQVRADEPGVDVLAGDNLEPALPAFADSPVDAPLPAQAALPVSHLDLAAALREWTRRADCDARMARWRCAESLGRLRRRAHATGRGVQSTLSGFARGVLEVVSRIDWEQQRISAEPIERR